MPGPPFSYDEIGRNEHEGTISPGYRPPHGGAGGTGHAVTAYTLALADARDRQPETELEAALYLFENGTKTLCDLSQFWAGVDSFLWLIGEAVFHVGIPVGICWSVAKKMGTTEMLGIVMGLTLVSSQLLNAYSVAGTAAAEIPKWDFGFFQINMIGYQAQVIPAMLAAFTLAYLERFFKKIVPQAISMIVVPFLSLLLAVMAAHWVLGPIGWKIGSAISSVVYAGITGSFKVVVRGNFRFCLCTSCHYGTSTICPMPLTFSSALTMAELCSGP